MSRLLGLLVSPDAPYVIAVVAFAAIELTMPALFNFATR